MSIWSSFSLVWAVISGVASTNVESRCEVRAVEALRALSVVSVSGGAIVARLTDSAEFSAAGVWTLRFCTAFADIPLVTD
jgi:hypothetical protein